MCFLCNGNLFQFLAPHNLKEQIPMLVLNAGKQVGNTSSGLSTSSSNPTNVAFEILRGSVIVDLMNHTEL